MDVSYINQINRTFNNMWRDVKYLLKYFLLRKTDILYTSILQFEKIIFLVSFWRAATHADITQSQNFLLQLEKSDIQEVK